MTKYRCIDNDDGVKLLTIGKVYEGEESESSYVRVLTDTGRFGLFLLSRFEVVPEAPISWRDRTITLGEVDAYITLAGSWEEFRAACGIPALVFIDPGMA